MKIFFDGGCRPNPGRMEIAVVARGHAHIVPDAGHGTSQDAEWLALIEAVRLAQRRRIADFVLIGDALAVIGPAKGLVKASGSAILHLRRLRELAGDTCLTIRHVGRAQNLAGIALARLQTWGQ